MKRVGFYIFFSLWINIIQTEIVKSAQKTTSIISESFYKVKQDIDQILYPMSDPFNEGYLRVSDLHSIWYAEYGNPKGIPVLVVHGGPGAGCSIGIIQYFDPKYYRIILVDQRGSPRSKPSAEMKENTTSNLISDFEQIRKLLKIDRWILFGGSWGSTLSLAYAEEHPKVIRGLLLTGVFLGSTKETNHVWYDLRDTYPEEWQEMVNYLPENERSNLIFAYNKRLMNPDPKVNLPAARALVKYECACSSIFGSTNIDKVLADDKLILGFARTFAYYSIKDFFLKPAQLINNITKINHLPVIIIQGRHDVITMPMSAYELHKNWPGSKLVFVEEAAHSGSDPALQKALLDAANEFKELRI